MSALNIFVLFLGKWQSHQWAPIFKGLHVEKCGNEEEHFTQINAYIKQHGWRGQFSTPVWKTASFDWMCKDSGFFITRIQTSCWLLFMTTLTPGHTLEISIFFKHRGNENNPHPQTHFIVDGLWSHRAKRAYLYSTWIRHERACACV